MALNKAAGYNLVGDATGPPSPGGAIRSMYDAAAQTQAHDYDTIMAGYDALGQRAGAGGPGGYGGPGGTGYSTSLNYVPISSNPAAVAKGANYSRSADFGDLVSRFQNFADTGGYSDDDLGNIRERGLSPLRAVYGNAQRNMNRQKSLSGGYSPNAGALTAKMAREQGELTSSATTAINAEIAKMVQAGKLSGMQGLSPMLQGENNLSNNMNMSNANMANEVAMSNAADERNVRDLNSTMRMRVDEMNNSNARAGENLQLSALQGKTNLYGTTPALTSTFGQQVLNNNAQELSAVQTANAIKNQRSQLGLGIAQARPSAAYPASPAGDPSMSVGARAAAMFGGGTSLLAPRR